MLLYNIDKKKKDSLNKLNKLVKEEKQICQEYTYILTDEFIEWFNKLFTLTKYQNCEFYRYDKTKTYNYAIILYDVLCDYISFQEQTDDKKTDLTYSINKNIKINNNIYNMVITSPTQYSPNSARLGSIYIHILNDDVDYDITLSDLQNFVIEQINTRQNSPLIFISEVVKFLEENNFNLEDILNALQINYTKVANKQIKDHILGR